MGEEKTVGCKMFLPFCRYFSHPANFLPARVPNSDPAGEDRACPANQASLSFPFHAPQRPHPFFLHNYLHPLLPAPHPRDSAASPPSTSIRVVLPHPSHSHQNGGSGAEPRSQASCGRPRRRPQLRAQARLPRRRLQGRAAQARRAASPCMA